MLDREDRGRESAREDKGRTDISHGRRDANLDTRVSFLCQLALEELVQFGVKDTVCDELPTLGNRGSWYGGHDGGAVEYRGGPGDAVMYMENC